MSEFKQDWNNIQALSSSVVLSLKLARSVNNRKEFDLPFNVLDELSTHEPKLQTGMQKRVFLSVVA